MIVIGPESSGTKFLTKLLIQSGFYGDWWHNQRLDKKIPNEKKVVLRRSYPHGGEWPKLNELILRFESAGYEVRIILIIRSMQFSIESRKRKGALNMDNMRRSLRVIGSQLEQTKVDYLWITYEAILMYKKLAIEWVFEWLGSPTPKMTGKSKIKDGNAKYLKEEKK